MSLRDPAAEQDPLRHQVLTLKKKGLDDLHSHQHATTFDARRNCDVVRIACTVYIFLHDVIHDARRLRHDAATVTPQSPSSGGLFRHGQPSMDVLAHRCCLVSPCRVTSSFLIVHMVTRSHFCPPPRSGTCHARNPPTQRTTPSAFSEQPARVCYGQENGFSPEACTCGKTWSFFVPPHTWWPASSDPLAPSKTRNGPLWGPTFWIGMGPSAIWRS